MPSRKSKCPPLIFFLLLIGALVALRQVTRSEVVMLQQHPHTSSLQEEFFSQPLLDDSGGGGDGGGSDQQQQQQQQSTFAGDDERSSNRTRTPTALLLLVEQDSKTPNNESERNKEGVEIPVPTVQVPAHIDPTTTNPSASQHNNMYVDTEALLNCHSEVGLSSDNNQTYSAQFCCADSWEQPKVDDWWQHHPDWEVSRQNDTTFCFSPMRHAGRADFLKNVLYPQQHLTNCSHVKSFILANSGFSANMALNGKAFMSASRHNQTYVNVKNDRKWRYGRYTNKSHVCETVDMDCYFLPLTNCKAPMKQKDDIPGGQSFNVNGGPNTWIREYMLRPRQWMRKRIYQVLKEVLQHPIPTPCSVIHVRRTDAILEDNWKKRRHYFPLSDYLAQVPEDHKSIVLLTDDQSAIDEAHDLHSDRHWIYVNRTRHRGTAGGMNGHIPSGDPVYELAVILAEMKIASRCHHLVFTRSGFKDLLLQAIQIGNHKNANLIQVSKIDWGKQPNETHTQSADDFFADMNAKRRKNGTTMWRQ